MSDQKHPVAVGRVFTRLVHRDGSQLVLGRLTDHAIVRTARWMRAMHQRPLDGFHVRAPLMMQVLDDGIERNRDDFPVRSMARPFFAAGLVVGCRLRDRAEGAADAMPLCVGFDDALAQLDGSDVLDTLWSSDWPRLIQKVEAPVPALGRLEPSLRGRLLLMFEVSRALPGRLHQVSLHFHFLMGLIGSGVGAPDPLWSDPGLGAEDFDEPPDS